jgi:hypothetical protein
MLIDVFSNGGFAWTSVLPGCPGWWLARLAAWRLSLRKVVR